MSTATTSDRRVLVVHHDHASPAGPVADRFAEQGFEVVDHLVVPAESFHAPGVAASFPDFPGFDAVVLLGSPWSAYDALVDSWVAPEIAQLRRADAAGVPVLGICFGGQLLAAAHGGGVAASPSPEVGWADIETDDSAVVPAGPWFQWHYDRWTLPPDATELARNTAASQAFVLRRNLALQFHPELTAPSLAGWLDNGGAALAASQGIDAASLTERTDQEGPDSVRRARALVDGFLKFVAAR
ncbi:type 1 glutamine amidotransferase [Actinoplanes sp. NPDC051513]|uniref:type 1 glutamine amidotransferase n=1 Tax=Actinoplanes sp. NPDC051513 TaxID=3363908 RepID=UPI0037AC11A4